MSKLFVAEDDKVIISLDYVIGTELSYNAASYKNDLHVYTSNGPTFLLRNKDVDSFLSQYKAYCA